MLTLPNVLSLLRAPLALVFFQENPFMRVTAVLIAMMTDGLDGYLARRRNETSQIGAFLDPLMDKFFVLVALTVFVSEGVLTSGAMLAMICRDLSVAAFGLYLVSTGQLRDYRFRSIVSGKITTFLQFIVLSGLALKVSFPPSLFGIFILLGLAALVELYIARSHVTA